MKCPAKLHLIDYYADNQRPTPIVLRLWVNINHRFTRVAGGLQGSKQAEKVLNKAVLKKENSGRS
jgi:hypothetical protein